MDTFSLIIGIVILWWGLTKYIDRKFSHLERSLRSDTDDTDGIPSQVNKHTDQRLERLYDWLEEKFSAVDDRIAETRNVDEPI